MPENETVLVCVTDQVSCDRLIRRGRELAEKRQCPLRVLHVRTRESTMLGNPDIGCALNQLYSLARETDAEMEIISSQAVEDTIADYALQHRASLIVLGETPRDRLPEMKERLLPRLPGVQFDVS